MGFRKHFIYLPSILIMILMLSETHVLSRAFFQSEFQDQVESVLFRQAEKEEELTEVMSGLISSLTFTCSQHDMEVLKSSRFKSRYILLSSLMIEGGKSCSSLGSHFSLPLQTMVDASVEKNGIHFINVGDSNNPHQKIVITYHVNNATLFFVLSSESFYKLLDGACEHCFYIELSSAGVIMITAGDESIKQEVNSVKHTLSAYFNELDVTIYAGSKLMDVATKKVKKAIIFTMLIGFLLVLAALFYRRGGSKTLCARIKNGIVHNEFIPFYQPIIDSSINKVVGAEVLARWHTNGEWVSPEQFIPYAENNGLIIPVTSTLFKQVIADMSKIPDETWVGLNISAKHFEGGNLDCLLQCADKVSPSRIVFEVTERHPIHNITEAAKKILHMNAAGYEFKLDDFGTGYGGFAYLQQLGIRSIKIDKMFVDTIGTSDLKTDLLDAIVAFGIKSGCDIVAEGVETKEQATFLMQRGVFLHQGYYYAKPMQLKSFLSFHNEFNFIRYELKQDCLN